ncbi:MAG: FecR domain-containing protein [Burkholderiales bacterium]|nr:FecR domain-containing protein [Burkholderiales bacterium]
MIRTVLLALLAIVPGAACAAAQALVEAVQSPAWVERGDQRQPLAAGMAIGNRDRIVSGADARVLLRMPEGSLVKLGENAQLALDRLDARSQREGGVVSAALDVLRGAFRFTTQASQRFRGRREIDIRIATVTAGIRGTDVWGKSAPERDIVCLIDGRISVQRQGEAAFTMDQPLSFYIAPRNAPAGPVQPVPREQLAQWAEETEIRAGAGAIRRGGQWKVYVAEAGEQAGALAAYDRVRAAGFPAEIRPVPLGGERFSYRVRVANLPSAEEAAGLAERLRSIPDLGEIRVSRN